MNLEMLQTEEIKDYIQAGRAKGCSMKEIVKEVAAARNDFMIPRPSTVIEQLRQLQAKVYSDSLSERPPMYTKRHEAVHSLR